MHRRPLVLVAVCAAALAPGAALVRAATTPPTAISISAVPNPVRYGAPTTVGGLVTGSKAAHRELVLESNPFPYTGGFHSYGNPQVTDSRGGFAFTVLSVPRNTQVRVRSTGKTKVYSPVLVLSSSVIVDLTVNRVRVRRGRAVRFAGAVTPPHYGTFVAIQRRQGTGWVTLGGTLTRRGRGTTTAVFTRRLRLRRGGSFRALAVVADGDHVGAVSRSIGVRVRRR